MTMCDDLLTTPLSTLQACRPLVASPRPASRLPASALACRPRVRWRVEFLHGRFALQQILLNMYALEAARTNEPTQPLTALPCRYATPGHAAPGLQAG